MSAPLDLDAIEARAADALRYGSHPSYLAGSASDVPQLVAEVRRLERVSYAGAEALRVVSMQRDELKTRITQSHHEACWRIGGELLSRAEAAELERDRLRAHITKLTVCADNGHVEAFSGGKTECNRCGALL